MNLTENELIGEIKKLGQIKPRKDWVVLTKSQILGQEQSDGDPISIISIFRVFSYKPKLALATVLSLFILFGLFSFAQNALPGDLLYVVKRIGEKSQAVFVSDQDKSAFQLKIANQRLEELTKAPARNLAPAISEFQASISEAAKNLAKFDAATSSPSAIKKIVEQTQKLKENRQKAESLGVVIDNSQTSELNDALRQMTDALIKDLEKRTLTEDKTKVLNQMKDLFDQEKYSDALELYLINQ